ncbi:MAG: rifampicin phosphotransferase, partial [Streptomyces sp.]|nr:rifampicin phosphotransferase [Streptomyces sp.]
MVSAGLPVPHFFCISHDAFLRVRVLVGDQLQSALDDLDHENPDSLAAGAEKIRQLFLDAALPPEVEPDVLAAFDASFGPDATVSVRSSMVGASGSGSEDSADDAMAGISDSFLYVSRHQVMDRV